MTIINDTRPKLLIFQHLFSVNKVGVVVVRQSEGRGIHKTTCMVSGADPGLDPQGALQPMVCTHELERSKPYGCQGQRTQGGQEARKQASSTGGKEEGRNNEKLKRLKYQNYWKMQKALQTG